MNSQAHPNLERSFQDSKPQDRNNNNTFLIVIAVKLFFAWLSPDKGGRGGGGGEEELETQRPQFVPSIIYHAL